MPDLSAQLDSLLYIDVCCADASDAVSIGHEAINWLRKRCSVDIDGQPLPFSLHQVFDSGLPDSILSIEVNETSTQSEEHILLKDTSIEARVYHLLENKSQLDDTNDLPHSIVTSLPYTGYQRFWDRLVFNPPMQLKLLNALARLVMLSQHPRDETNTATSVETRSDNPRKVHAAKPACWNGIVLLWGEPGTGKTTLCKALAQKLSIRLRPRYDQTKLIELDGNSMYSKYFGDSAKIVSGTFATIKKMLSEDEKCLFIILIDEIESLAGARSQTMGSNEPKDSLRAVNALLTSIDSLRSHSNFLVFCTSNLINAMDDAFLDRVDFKFQIPTPDTRARYEILRLRLLDLASADLITTPTTDSSEGLAEILAPYESYLLQFSHLEDHPARSLWKIAEKCEELSGRSLHRLPALALALYTKNEPCELKDMMTALAQAVDEEILSIEKMRG